MFAKLMFTAVAALAPICGCHPSATPAPAPAVLAPCQGAVVTVDNGDPVGCNLTPPQRLDVAYPGSDGIEVDKFVADCDDMGGELIWSDDEVTSAQFVCEGVDY